MTHRSDIVIGFVENQTILAALASYPEDAMNLHGVLITCVDSTRLTSAVSAQHEFCQYPNLGRALDFGFLVAEGRLSEFFGSGTRLLPPFSEMWLWAQRGQITKPPVLAITSECPLVATSPPVLAEERASIRRWMHNSKCILALGDGCGLNFITSDHRWSEKLAQLDKTHYDSTQE